MRCRDAGVGQLVAATPKERCSMASVWLQAEATEASCRLRQYPGDLCLRSLTTSSAIDAQAPPPDLGGRDQWRSYDVKALAGSSQITSSVRRSRILFKCERHQLVDADTGQTSPVGLDKFPD
jgi:hypothetical protein